MNDLIRKYKENSSRICAVLLGLVLFLLPFEMFPRAELFGATVRLSQVAGLLLIVFSAPVIITRWRDWLKQPWLLLALFVLVSLVSSYFAISKSRGLMVSSFYIFNFVLAYAASQAFDIKNSQVYKKIIYISGLVVVTFCLFQFVGDTLGISNRLTLLDLRYTKLIFGFARVQGFSIEPLYLASYLMIPFCLALASYIFSNKKYEAAMATVFLTTIFMTVARGAYLAVFAVLIGFAIFMIYQKKWQQLGVTVAIIFGSAVVAFGLIWASGSFAAQIDKDVNVPSDLQTNIPQEGIDAGGNASRLIDHTTDFADESSFSDRLKTSKTAIAAGLRNPVLGVGPGNFGRYVVKNYPGQYEDTSQIANNETFEILAEQGFVGLVIILAFGLSMLLMAVKYCSKKHSLQSNIWALASGGMLVAFVVQWQTFSTLYVTHIWVIVGVYISLVFQSKKIKLTKIHINLSSLRSFIYKNYIALIIIMAFALLHLPGITAPPVDEHSWRQTDTAGVARNFTYESANILYPRVDGRGQFSGVTGMEFPIYNYTVSILDRLVGFASWHGRVISLLAGVMGLIFFYALLSVRYSKRVANYGLLAMSLSPLYFYFSRNIQPDVLMVALSIGSLYFAQLYVKKSRLWHLLACFCILSLAILIKIPAVFMAIPLAYILWPVKKQIFKFTLFSSLILIVILPNAAWYIHSDNLSKNYGLGQYFYGELGLKLVIEHLEMLTFWRRIFVSNTLLKSSTALFAILAAYGSFVSIKKKDYLPIIWVFAIALFLIAFANKSFYHNYYSIPIVPAIALLAALGLSEIQNKLRKAIFIPALAILIVTSVLLMVYSIQKLYIPQDKFITQLGPLSEKYIRPDSLIVTNNGGSPAMLYFANRKGWNPPDVSITSQYLATVKSQGAEYLVLRKPNYPYPDKDNWPATLIYTGENYDIYQLN